MADTYYCDILSIDARRDRDSWTWNQWWTRGTVALTESDLTPRKFCRMLREQGYLSDYSRGRVRVDMGRASEQVQIEIQDKATGEPLFAIVER